VNVRGIRAYCILKYGLYQTYHRRIALVAAGGQAAQVEGIFGHVLADFAGKVA